MTASEVLIEQCGRVGSYQRETVPFMHVALEDEPGAPSCVRVFLSGSTWDAIRSDRKATDAFYDAVLTYPRGTHELFGQDFRRALQRHRGQMPSEHWLDSLAD